MLSSMHQFGVKMTKIQLKCMDKVMVNYMLSMWLGLLPRITRPLSDLVHFKTKGNPLFISELMIALSKEQLLFPSLAHHRWTWNDEKICNRKVPQEVVSFITESLKHLPREVFFSLDALSCFGTSANLSIIEALESELGITLSTGLSSAIDEGIIMLKDATYFFAHDKVQEAIYNKKSPDERYCKSYCC